MLLLEYLVLGFAKSKIFATLWKTCGLVFDAVFFYLWNEGETNQINTSLSLIHPLGMKSK